MSTWRVLVKALHAVGGTATLRVIGAGMSEQNRDAGVTRARELGLIEWPASTGRGSVCRITQLGIDLAEGRAEVGYDLFRNEANRRGYRKMVIVKRGGDDGASN